MCSCDGHVLVVNNLVATHLTTGHGGTVLTSGGAERGSLGQKIVRTGQLYHLSPSRISSG